MCVTLRVKTGPLDLKNDVCKKTGFRAYWSSIIFSIPFDNTVYIFLYVLHSPITVELYVQGVIYSSFDKLSKKF